MLNQELINIEFGPQLIILIVFGLALIIQIALLFIRYLPLALFKQKEADENLPSVSVVICARNEEENIEKYLPLVLNQDYPNFEVIVVNDCSWDNSYDLLEKLKKSHPNLKVAEIKQVENREHGKKFALTIGIKAAVNDILLLTDADCYPSSNQWIKQMMSGYRPNKYIVLGYGKYDRKPGLLNNLIRYDTFMIGSTSLGMALRGNTYMGVGRNLSYHRALFFAVKGFASHIHLASGDDDLFVNEVADSKNTAIAVSPESLTISNPKETFSAWMRQKKRHLSTGKHYKSKHKFLLVLEPATWYLMMISAIAGLLIQYNLLILISGLCLRACLQIGILHAIAKKFAETDMGWKSPFLEVIYKIFLAPVFAFYSLFAKQSKWT
ncbi:MAG: glycosyltransferase [Bacteroidia bacterium]